jgi:hypothetical protein
MAIKTHDTNPALSTAIIRELLMLENEIDKHLMAHLIGGRTSYLVTASAKNVVDLLIDRFRRAGWTVTLAYTGGHLFRLEFEDPDQMEQTRKLKAIRPTPVSASSGYQGSK